MDLAQGVKHKGSSSRGLAQGRELLKDHGKQGGPGGFTLACSWETCERNVSTRSRSNPAGRLSSFDRPITVRGERESDEAGRVEPLLSNGGGFMNRW